MATPTQRDVRDYSSQTARLRLEQLKATPPACRLCIQWHSSGTTMVGSQRVNLDIVGKYFSIVFERLKVAGVGGFLFFIWYFIWTKVLSKPADGGQVDCIFVLSWDTVPFLSCRVCLCIWREGSYFKRKELQEKVLHELKRLKVWLGHYTTLIT
ncbi:hypothetical protein BKA70DRAFT_1229593 [Coprinopsis sp. MPI-PUGE-AT-0042]|nr:hypothetical protein BKA70DRAFT_1229593 [Coprinopsis sp. MPI-PUGE-AT-0042]